MELDSLSTGPELKRTLIQENKNWAQAQGRIRHFLSPSISTFVFTTICNTFGGQLLHYIPILANLPNTTKFSRKIIHFLVGALPGTEMGLLSNRVPRATLKPGDHIYSWRTAYIYAHHGIYVGDDRVVHFTRRGQELGTGTVLDHLLVSSMPARSPVPCPTCTPPTEGHGVVSSCLNCFLAGGILYRFEYAVSPAHFLAKARGGTCTLAVSDPSDMVVHRANYLLDNGFGCYNVFKNNCEDFAIYCKTGLLVLDQATIGQGGQAVSIVGGPLAAVLSTPLRLISTNIYGMAATAVGVYCASRYAADLGSGMRRDAVKVSVEDLTRRLQLGLLQVVEQQRLTAAPTC